MSRQMVENWLQRYMFKGDPDGAQKATDISRWLATHSNFQSHSKHIPRDEAESHGLKVVHLEADQTAQNLFLSVFHATTHTFSATSVVKIIENHLGRAFMKQQMIQPFMIQQPPGMPQQ